MGHKAFVTLGIERYHVVELHKSITVPLGRPMAKINYAYEKRQRELAKKKKKEEKRAKKAESTEPEKNEGAQQPGTAPNSGEQKPTA